MNASDAPIHTDNGRPRDARISEANIVLSGSSPKKISGKTASTIPICTRAFYPMRYLTVPTVGTLTHRSGT